jgi:hypothetical protein
MTRTLFLCLAISAAAFGQAAVEAGLGASRAATSTAPAKGLGKSMAGIAGTLDKALKPAQKEADELPAKSPVTTAKAAPAPTSAPAPKYEDAAAIEPGLAYADLVRRFGPPAMSTTYDGETTLSYSGKAGMYQLKVVEGKVKSLEKPQP